MLRGGTIGVFVALTIFFCGEEEAAQMFLHEIKQTLADSTIIFDADNTKLSREFLCGGTIGLFVALTIFFLRRRGGGSNVPARD